MSTSFQTLSAAASLFPCRAQAAPIDMPANRETAPEREDIDSVCLQAAAAGDREAFANLVERWQGRLINFFYRSVGNRADAEDLAQETLVDLYKNARRYEPQNRFAAYLFTLARRRMIDRLRKEGRRPLDYLDPSDLALTNRPEATDATYEIEEAFQNALRTLADNQREAILLLQQQGLTYEEIATTMQASLSSVKTWIHRARIRLREALKDFT